MSPDRIDDAIRATRGSNVLRLTPGARQRIVARGRPRIAVPESRRAVDDWIETARRARPGVPPDVLMELESLRLLGDAGNRIAAWLFESECKRLGLWYDRRLWTRPGGPL